MDDNVGDSGQYGGLLRPLSCSCGKWTIPSGANRLQSIDDLTWHRRPPGQCEHPDDPDSPNPADKALWETVRKVDQECHSPDTLDPMEPRLGLATNEQLLQELITRLEGILLTDQSPGVSAQRIKHVGWALRLAVMLGEMDAVTKEYRTVER